VHDVLDVQGLRQQHSQLACCTPPQYPAALLLFLCMVLLYARGQPLLPVQAFARSYLLCLGRGCSSFDSLAVHG
jgi:hypothetical protein